jgi:glycosyltransferase involved in cell wall biosynthesis
LDRVHRVVATSRRQFDDLLHQRGVPAEKLALIPHGIDTAAFEEAHRQRERLENQPLRIGYLGRLLDSAKGIFLLPKILHRLDQLGTPAHLTIVGDGPDRQRLERRLDPWIAKGRAIVMGRRHQSEIPRLLSQWDVLAMPSSFEGFGFSLIEGMAAGLVPVVSKISGVTDWIVQDGSTGYVCPIGDATSFADRIHLLAGDRTLLETMSQATHDDARSRFSLPRMGDDYHALFESVMAAPTSSRPPAPWSEFELCKGFEPTFRRWIPGSVKARLRALLERWRARGE